MYTHSIKSLCCAIALLTLLYSCGKSASRHEEMINQETLTSETSEAQSADFKTDENSDFEKEKIAGVSRKVMKTADVRSRVQDVLAKTTVLETTAQALSGVVISSTLKNDITNTKQVPLSSDSIEEIQSYTTTAYLTFKIPVMYMDSFMNIVIHDAQFINYRNLKLDDLTMQYVSNQMKQEAMRDNLKTKDVNSAIYNDEKKENQIDQKVENLAIADQVKYATVSIELYQPQRVEKIVIANIDQLVNPSFGTSIRMGIQNGWDLLKYVFIAISNLWTVILIGLIIYWIVFKKKVFNRNKTQREIAKV